MTEEEKARLRTVKAEVTAWLAAEKIGRYELKKLDRRVDSYVREVAANPEKHNVWEQLAVRRFLGMCDRYGIRVDKVRTFFAFYEQLTFPGNKGPQRYELTPVQAFQFASIFAFWQGDRRVVREVCLYVPRKFSKTTGTASLAVWDLLFGEGNAEAYVGANSSDQAKKCFDVIRGCVRAIDPKEQRYGVNEQRIKARRKDRTAFAQCLTANARTKDGLNASTVIMDEFSQARDSNLLTVLTTSMGVRKNPLTVIITTASDVFDGPFYAMLQGYKSVLLGDVEDDALFAHIFEPDPDDNEGDPATWRKVHPHMGVTVSEDFYRSEWKKAKRDGAAAMLAFRTKLLNVYAENEQKAWISATEAKKHMVKIDPLKMGHRYQAMIGIDLSESDDFSAVSIAFYRPSDYTMHFHTAYFFPEGALPGHPNERLYRAWAEAGHLRLLKGEVIDYDAIVEYVISLIDAADVQGIGYDRWKSLQMINDLMAHPDAIGVNTVLQAVPQTYAYFTGPVEAFEHGVKTDKIFIDENPITAFCFGNAVLDFDSLENCKPVKRSHNMKIDGVVTMLMCMRQWLDIIQQPGLPLSEA